MLKREGNTKARDIFVLLKKIIVYVFKIIFLTTGKLK